MKTVHSSLHRLQDAPYEFIRGKQVPSFEMPRRAEIILARVKEMDLGPVIEPEAFGTDPLSRVHSRDFVTFLSTIWQCWSAENGDVPALPNAWVPPRARRLPTRRPGAELGRYCIDMSSPILAGTWTAALAGADTALTGAKLVMMQSERAAFALCRPPGHHAGHDFYGGYCFLNNAAVAARWMIDASSARVVAVLDIDYHHGNGTQDIFYADADILVVSVHAQPEVEYPYYSGYADETGVDAGEGCNLNLPLPHRSAMEDYRRALGAALERIASFGAEAVVVSLGVDTFEGDPISHFRLQSPDFTEIGAMIGGLALPTLFVMEGGYAVADLGVNTVNVLAGFEDA